jgi:murein L,D-transpeptidase YcbB/YkuD
MHDTNQPYLFSKNLRALSNGCVRLHKPFELLESLSEIDSNINFAKIKLILEENKKSPIRLKNTIPIDIIYLTSWVDREGEVQFRDDIYDYDKLQLSQLK